MDDHGQPAPMVIGGKPTSLDGIKGEFTGCAITIQDRSAELTLEDVFLKITMGEGLVIEAPAAQTQENGGEA